MAEVERNWVRCRRCGETIESTHRHDYVRCSCGAVAVDGGQDYQKIMLSHDVEPDVVEHPPQDDAVDYHDMPARGPSRDTFKNTRSSFRSRVLGSRARPETACPFCELAAGRGSAGIVREWPDALAFTPLNPVTPGHVLVIPRVHVVDFTVDPIVSGATMARAAELAGQRGVDANVISSAGIAASQTVNHLHLHVVPRRTNDGLALPWTKPG